MLQRIQSVFLFLGSISFWGLFAFPFAKSDAAMAGLFEDLTYNIHDHIVLMLLSIIGGILAFAAIFLYKNRMLQVKFGYVLITLAILIIAVALLLVLQDNESDLTGSINEGLGLGLPLFSIIFAALSIRYIKKDEKLVKSMDRLR